MTLQGLNKPKIAGYPIPPLILVCKELHYRRKESPQKVRECMEGSFRSN